MLNINYRGKRRAEEKEEHYIRKRTDQQGIHTFSHVQNTSLPDAVLCCCHLLWDSNDQLSISKQEITSQVEKVMPSDTFYFTILRNPVTLMESAFTYYKNTSSFSKAKNIEDFLNNSNKFYQRDQLDSGFAKNPMTFDLGFDHNGPVLLKHFKLPWRAVDAIFDLVLIAEYFDESLVLLKDALCWNLDDVLSFPLNTRSNKSRSNLSDEAQERIKSWNQLDWQLYIYFNNSFWNHVERFGRERMRYEVEKLKTRRAQLSEKCLDGQVDPSLLKDKSMLPKQFGLATILGYNLKSGLEQNDQKLCHRLVLPEVQYNDLLKKKQVGL
ncbi:galactose-3-O-sulfotransferase 4-like [Bufo gargarizans]|uniref:galactose-3-O-sulfotransferase 4-like n=1 Tax=Bufo gargarizans TaxID=30331 RepID=UPI001CF5CDA8|nr:galactose-3-O-sulfotransferase 4-like [Bufo gargarizans]